MYMRVPNRILWLTLFNPAFSKMMSTKYFFVASLLASILPVISGHGHLSDPLPRGVLRGNMWTGYTRRVDRSAPEDIEIHFPAGDRINRPVAGLRSQKLATPSWTPFEPMKLDFRWRAGLCGDVKWQGQDHMRGGKFYYEGKISRTLVAGTDVNFQASIVAHHNGFFEFHLCDVSKCGGEISKECFYNGACRQLKRARNSHCDSGRARWCGPIDRSHPGRWYLPCPDESADGGWDPMGRSKTMTYEIPKDMVCEHCVLHWLYTTANICNPPGMVDYFTGSDRPVSWEHCEGPNGAIGGYPAWAQTCGGQRYSEEYYNCADVRVVSRHAKKKNPIDTLHFGSIERRNFVVRKELTGSHRLRIWHGMGMSVRAKLKWPVKELVFYIKRKGKQYHIRKDGIAPFYMFGSDEFGRPLQWPTPILNEWIEIIVKVDGFELRRRVYLYT